MIELATLEQIKEITSRTTYSSQFSFRLAHQTLVYVICMLEIILFYSMLLIDLDYRKQSGAADTDSSRYTVLQFFN